MKNKFKLLFAAIAFVGLTSCEDENSFEIISPSPVQFTTISPENGSNIVLDENNPDNPALVISWNPAVYDGLQTQITYSVEVDKDGDEFDTPYSLGSTTARTLTVTVAQLNTAASEIELPVGSPQTMNVRVKATVGTTGSLPSYSNVLNYTVTSYLTYTFRDLFLVGSATAPGWNNNNNNPALWRNPANPNLYEYTGYFIGGGGDGAKFKLLETLGLWQPQWGTNGGSTIAGNPGTQSNDPGEFQNTGASGYYKLTVDMSPSSLGYTFTPYAGSTSTIYSSVGIIGSSTPGGWDAETPMTQSTFDSHIWYLNNVALINGEAKFRANGSWDVNWGANTEYSGTGTQGGANIPVSGTNYNVWFNDLTGQYMLVPVE